MTSKLATMFENCEVIAKCENLFIIIILGQLVVKFTLHNIHVVEDYSPFYYKDSSIVLSHNL